MKIITVNIHEAQVRAMQLLQDLGLYPSRSEQIRVAIRDLLQNELGFAQKFDLAMLPNERLANEATASKKKEIARLLHQLRENQPCLAKVA